MTFSPLLPDLEHWSQAAFTVRSVLQEKADLVTNVDHAPPHCFVQFTLRLAMFLANFMLMVALNFPN